MPARGTYDRSKRPPRRLPTPIGRDISSVRYVDSSAPIPSVSRLSNSRVEFTEAAADDGWTRSLVSCATESARGERHMKQSVRNMKQRVLLGPGDGDRDRKGGGGART